MQPRFVSPNLWAKSQFRSAKLSGWYTKCEITFHLTIELGDSLRVDERYINSNALELWNTPWRYSKIYRIHVTFRWSNLPARLRKRLITTDWDCSAFSILSSSRSRIANLTTRIFLHAYKPKMNKHSDVGIQKYQFDASQNLRTCSKTKTCIFNCPCSLKSRKGIKVHFLTKTIQRVACTRHHVVYDPSARLASYSHFAGKLSVQWWRRSQEAPGANGPTGQWPCQVWNPLSSTKNPPSAQRRTLAPWAYLKHEGCWPTRQVPAASLCWESLLLTKCWRPVKYFVAHFSNMQQKMAPNWTVKSFWGKNHTYCNIASLNTTSLLGVNRRKTEVPNWSSHQPTWSSTICSSSTVDTQAENWLVFQLTAVRHFNKSLFLAGSRSFMAVRPRQLMSDQERWSFWNSKFFKPSAVRNERPTFTSLEIDEPSACPGFPNIFFALLLLQQDGGNALSYFHDLKF